MLAEDEPAPEVLVLAQEPRKSVAAVRRNVGMVSFMVGLFGIGGLVIGVRCLFLGFQFF